MNQTEDSITKYKNALEQYIKQLMPAFEAKCDVEAAKYEQYLVGLKQLYYFSSYLIEDVRFWEKKEVKKETHDAIAILFVKASQSLLALEACLRNGCLVESALILRALFEDHLNLKIILLADTDLRAELYLNYEHVDRYNNLKNNRELLSGGIMSQKEFDATYKDRDVSVGDIVSNYERIKGRYYDKKSKRVSYKWYYAIFGDISLKKYVRCQKLGRL